MCVGEFAVDTITDIGTALDTAGDWMQEQANKLFDTSLNICKELCKGVDLFGVLSEVREFCESSICEKTNQCAKETFNTIWDEVDELLDESRKCVNGKIREFKECNIEKIDNQSYNALNLAESNKKCKEWSDCTIVSLTEKPFSCHAASTQKAGIQLFAPFGIDYEKAYTAVGDFTCKAAQIVAGANGKK